MRIVVLGAGVIGTATAFMLAEAGHTVTVIDRAPDAGEGTSRANGAILHPSSVAPWSAPGMPRQILRWMGDPDAPFLLRPSALPRMWRWGLDFLRECNPQRHAANAASNLALAIETLGALDAIRARTGITWHRRPAGVLKLYSDPAALDTADAKAKLLRAAGLDVRRLDPAGVAAVDPKLARIGNRIVGALHCQQDEVSDAREFCVRLAAWSAAHQAVEYRFNTAVEGLDLAGGAVRGVRTSSGTIAAEAVVVALGPHSEPFLRAHGVRPKIWPVKGVSVTMPRSSWPLGPEVALLDDSRRFAFVPLDGRVRVVGSAEVAGFDATPDPARIRAMTRRVADLFPDFPSPEDPGTIPGAELWAGLRPVRPGGTPLIGPAGRIGGLWLNTGHGHTGWTQSAGSAARLAAMMGRV